MTKFLVVDDNSGTNDTFSTLADVFDHFKDEEVSERSKWDLPTVYEIVREVKYDSRPTEFFEVNDTVPAIPAPNPGESVTDYAKRITTG